MEPSENRFRTDIWPLGHSRATSIPPRILLWTQAPDGEDAEVRWRYDSDQRLYVEFGRTSDENAYETYARRTTIQKRSEGSRATAIPIDILRGEDATEDDEAVWTFNLREEHPVRIQFVSHDDEAGDES
ncbi:hypothetical protein ACLI4R_17565 [Natrialbaceae archaeon A-chndr2]